MRKALYLTTLFALLGHVILPVSAEGGSIKPKSNNVWELYQNRGEIIATIKKLETGGFSFYDKGGKFIGIILTSGTWIPWNAKKRRTRIEPEEAELYLEVLRSINQLK